MVGKLVESAGCMEGARKSVDDFFLDDLRAFGVNADLWTTATKDDGEWCRAAEQREEHFMAKWIAADKDRYSVIGDVPVN